MVNNASPARPGWFERHGWKILIGLSVIIGLFGIGDMLGGASDLQAGEAVLMQGTTGTTWDALNIASPGAANLINMHWRSGGASLFTIAVLLIVICLRGFRRGERWAWLALWVLPVWTALTDISIWMAVRDWSIGTPVPIISGSIVIVASVATLALSARAFFRPAPAENAAPDHAEGVRV